jgi:hypothetical protein
MCFDSVLEACPVSLQKKTSTTSKKKGYTVHLTSTCAIVSPILKPFNNVAQIPSQHVVDRKEPPSSVTPHVPMAVHMMHTSHTNHMAVYMRTIHRKTNILRTDLHARILHSLHQNTKKKQEIWVSVFKKKQLV